MIKVLHPGIYNTIQDQGRFGFAKLGVPLAGAIDAYAAEFGKAIVGGKTSDAVIEITFGQGKFQFMETTIFCLTGGDFSPTLDGDPIGMNRLYNAETTAVLSFGKRNYGAITYLAVQGGVQTDRVLKSRSFSKGITRERLEKGDELEILKQEEFTETKYARIRMPVEHFNSAELPCFPGPEFDQLNEKQKQRLFEPFTLSADQNRVGYRLNEPIENNLDHILTSSVLPGTVQLTPSGTLIVLMNDCQVSGGYPRVLQLSEYATSRLSQKVAGDKVQFTR